MRDSVLYRALTLADRPEIMRFMLNLDEETLWNRFGSMQTVRSILHHFSGLIDDNARFYAAYHGDMIGLGELYRFDQAWSRAELAITVHPRATSDQIFGELSNLTILELAKLGTAELYLNHRDYTRRLARYFDVFPIIKQDNEHVHLNLLDDAL